MQVKHIPTIANWLVHRSGAPLLGRAEFPLFTDAWITGELSLGPYHALRFGRSIRDCRFLEERRNLMHFESRKTGGLNLLPALMALHSKPELRYTFSTFDTGFAQI